MYFLNYIESVYEKFSGFPEFQFHFNKVKESNVKTLLLYEIEKNLKESLQPIQIWSYDLIVRYPPSSWKKINLNYHIMVLLSYLLSVALLEKDMYDKPIPSDPQHLIGNQDGYYTKKNKKKRKEEDEDENQRKPIKRQKLNPENWRDKTRMLELINNESILEKLSENSGGEGLLGMISNYEESLDELFRILNMNETDPRYQLFFDYDPSSIILHTIDEMESDETFISKNLSLLVNKLSDIRILIDELKDENGRMVEEEKKTEARGFEEKKETMVEEEEEEEETEREEEADEREQTITAKITKVTKILITSAFVTVFYVLVFSFLNNGHGTITQESILNFLEQYSEIVEFDWADIYKHIKPVDVINNDVLKWYLIKFITRISMNISEGITTINGVDIEELKKIAVEYFDFLKNL